MNKTFYKNSIIYFWSGTGNSFRIATWIGMTAKGQNVHTRVLSIEQINSEEVKIGRDVLLGIVFPTHGFTAPWYLLKFVCRLPRGHLTPAFCAATRAGLKIGSFIIPGISGSANFIVALLLFLKGYKVKGCMSVDMPSNWYSLHPIQSRKSQEAIIARAQKKVAHFTERIFSKRKVWFTFNNFIEATWGILLSLISVGYLFIGRIFLAKLFFANRNCNGCGICAEYCGVGAIKMWGKENPKPFWKYSCESCMRCSAFCPHHAIEAGHSWGVILYFITALPVSAYLFSWLNAHIIGLKYIEADWSGRILKLIYCYPAIFISYYIFTFLNRIPAINWVYTHTTLTHLPFWGRYREPGTQLKNIAKRISAVDQDKIESKT